MDIKTMLVLSKKVNVDDQEFEVYYGYRQDKNKDGEFVDRLTPVVDKEGKPAMISKSIKIALAGEFLDSVKDKTFPLFVTIDMDKVDENGRKVNYVTIDKDSNKNVRKDKNGNKHLILIIRKAEEVIEAPRKSYSLDDVDTFNG